MTDTKRNSLIGYAFGGIADDLKKEPANIRQAFSVYGRDVSLRSKTFISKQNIRGLIVDLLAVVVIGLVVSLLCSLKSGGMDLFLSVMLPFVAIGLCQFFIASFYESSIPYTTLTVILIFLGAALQIMLMLPVEDPSGAFRLAIYAGVGTVAGLIGIPVLHYIVNYMNKRLAALLTLGLAVLLYLVLLIAAPNISGTRAWLIIGSVSLQLTEVTKVLAVISFACIYSDEDASPLYRLIYAVAALAVHGVALVVINELGTLVVISIIFVVLGMAFLPSAKGLIAVMLVGLLCVAAMVGFSWKCYQIYYGEPEETETVTAAQTAETEAAGEAEAGLAVTPTEVTEAPTEKEHGVLYEKVVGKAANIFYKIRTRFLLVLDPDSMDENNEGYQAKMARKAMLITGWLGSAEEYEQNVPVIESDYIFLYVLMKIGIVGAFIVLAMMIALMMETVIRVAAGGHIAESATAIGFICCIVVQSIITAASSAGLIPTVGLTFAFLSDGGSATVMNYIMTYFIIFAMRRQIPVPAPAPRIDKKAAQQQGTGRDAVRGAVWRAD